MEFLVLGAAGVRTDGRVVDLGGPRQRRLLAALLLHRDEVVSIDRLVDAVFEGRPTPSAEATLRTYVTRLRRRLGRPPPTVIAREGAGYRLMVPAESTDAYAFSTGVSLGRQALARGDPAAASETLRAALDLWRGEAYEDVAEHQWALPEVRRLDEQRQDARASLAEAWVGLGETARAVAELRALLTEDPFSESVVEHLMRALYRSGRPHEALDAFDAYRRATAEDLGLAPAPSLLRLQARVLAREPGLDSDGVSDLRGYRIGERLGSGRLGPVHTARLGGVAREYAIRFYPGEFADDPVVMQTFEADVRSLVALDVPGLVALTDAWREPGSAVLVMQLLPGGTLEDRLGAGPVSWDLAAEVLGVVGVALLALARAGRHHGRVRPSSVLFDAAGRPHLAEPELGRAARSTASTDDEDFRALVRTLCAATREPAARRLLGQVDADRAEPHAGDSGGCPSASLVLSVLDTAEPRACNPYVGLRPFDVGDADRLFGRESLTSELLVRLERAAGTGARLLLLVGSSGSGKSSVLRAGVLPAVTAAPRSWRPTVLIPGADPMGALEQALRRVSVVGQEIDAARLASEPGALATWATAALPGDTSLLLAIDQLEELFTLATARRREAFLAAVAEATTRPGCPVHVLATLRADYFDRPLDHPVLAPLAGPAAVPVPAMSPAELERAITGPAASRIDIEDGLVAELLAAVSAQPAALPALQFTLHALAERGGDTLRLGDLAELGGVHGAIAQHAEALFTGLDGRRRAVVRSLLRQMVVVDRDGVASRARVPRALLLERSDDPEQADDLLETWIGGRLLVADRTGDTRVPTVELAHDAVLERWPRLCAWVDEDRSRLMATARFGEAAEAWAEEGRDPASLLRGARLEQAAGLLGEEDTERGVLREFVAASLAQRDAERETAAAADRQRARTTRRLRHQRAALAAAAAAVLVVTLLALDLRRQTVTAAADEQERAAAAAAGLIDTAGELASSDWSLALLLGVEAHRLDPTRATELGVARTLADPRPVPTTVRSGGRGYSGVVADPAQAVVAAWSPDGLVELVDLATGDVLRSVRGTGADPAPVLHSGLLVVSDRQGGRGVVVIDDRLEPVLRLASGSYVTDMVFDETGTRLAVGDTSGTVSVLEVDGWSRVDSMLLTPGVAIEQVAWSPTGALLGVDSAGTFATWAMSGTAPSGLGPPRSPVASRRFEDAPDGLEVSSLEPVAGTSLVLVTAVGRMPFHVDVADLGFIVELGEPGEALTTVTGSAVSPDGASTAHASIDHVLLRRRVAGSNPFDVTARRIDVDVAGVAFDPTGALVTVGLDGRVRRWSVPEQTAGMTAVPDLGAAAGLSFGEDGRTLLRWGRAAGVTVLDIEGPDRYVERSAVPAGISRSPTGAAVVEARPAGQHVVVLTCPGPSVPARWVSGGSCDASLTTFDLASGAVRAGPVEVGDVRPGAGSALAMSADAGVIATSSSDGTITTRDPGTLTVRMRVPGPVDHLGRPSASDLQIHGGSGLLLATSAVGGDLQAWSLADEALPPVMQATDVAGGALGPGGEIWTVSGQGLAVSTPPGYEPEPRSNDGLGLLSVSTSAVRGLLLGSDREGGAWVLDIRTGEVVLGPVPAVAAVLAPDGSHALVADGTSTRRLPLAGPALVHAACRAAGRVLTEDEWVSHLGTEEPYRPTCEPG